MQNQQFIPQLLRFIDFHNRSESILVNSINSIIADCNIETNIIQVFNTLQISFITLNYPKSESSEMFLQKLFQNLMFGKKVLITTDTLNFNPSVHDQLTHFREENRFIPDQFHLHQAPVIFPSSSKIFLYHRGIDAIDDIYAISDHILNLREVN
jgi:hypothetical protein